MNTNKKAPIAYPISWHRERLNYERAYLEALKLERSHQDTKIGEARARIALISAQIDRALELGIEFFRTSTPVEKLSRKAKP